MSDFQPIPMAVESGWTTSEYITHLLGDSYRLLFYPDGTVRFEHRCDRGDRGIIICAPALSEHHVLSRTIRPDQKEAVTITPSILCPDCNTHGFIRESRWVEA
jgi:hypothetical protein